jgi:hypothetical protein
MQMMKTALWFDGSANACATCTVVSVLAHRLLHNVQIFKHMFLREWSMQNNSTAVVR